MSSSSTIEIDFAPVKPMLRTRWLLAILLTGLFMNQVDTAVVNVAAPSIRRHLGASAGEVELVISGYVLAYAMLLITGARLGDMYGYQRVFRIGLIAFTGASAVCGFASNPLTLIVARAVQGAGAALIVPQVLTGIQRNFAGPARTRAIGFYTATLSGGAVAGQVLGGVLVSADLFGSQWRPIFLINLPIGLGLILAASRLLPAETEIHPQRLDLGGVATLAAAVLLFLVPLIVGRDQGWPLWIWLCLATSLPVLALFLHRERQLAELRHAPLVNLHVIARPPVGWGIAAHAIAGIAYFGMLFVVALYLQQGLGKSAFFSGLCVVSWVAAFGIAGPLVHRCPPRLRQTAASLGYCLMAASFLLVCLTHLAGNTSSLLVIVLLGFGGLGLGIGFSAIIGHLTSTVPPAFAPDLSGVMATAIMTAGATGVAIFGTLYFSLAAPGEVQTSTHAFGIVSAGFSLAGLGAAAAAYLATSRVGAPQTSRQPLHQP